MTITLNGQPYPFSGEISITDLLTSIGLSGKPVVVELNKEPILPRLFPNTLIQANDQLEIITLAAGG